LVVGIKEEILVATDKDERGIHIDGLVGNRRIVVAEIDGIRVPGNHGIVGHQGIMNISGAYEDGGSDTDKGGAIVACCRNGKRRRISMVNLTMVDIQGSVDVENTGFRCGGIGIDTHCRGIDEGIPGNQGQGGGEPIRRGGSEAKGPGRIVGKDTT
jgi:hypothetical protein